MLFVWMSLIGCIAYSLWWLPKYWFGGVLVLSYLFDGLVFVLRIDFRRFGVFALWLAWFGGLSCDLSGWIA